MNTLSEMTSRVVKNSSRIGIMLAIKSMFGRTLGGGLFGKGSKVLNPYNTFIEKNRATYQTK